MLERLQRAGRSVQAFVLPASIAGVALVAYFAATLWPDVYRGVPDSIPVKAISATCAAGAAQAPCAVNVFRLNPGRFYLRTAGPASSMTVLIDDPAAVARSRVLLARPEAPGRLIVDASGGEAHAEGLARNVAAPFRRVLVATSESPSPLNRITFVPTESNSPIVVSELGLFESDRDLIRSSRQPFQRISGVAFYSTVVVSMTLAVCAFVVAAAFVAPGVMSRPAPWLLVSLCAAICVIDLGTMFSPYWSHDIRSMYGAELIASGFNGNLTGGLYEGSRLVQGLGQTTEPHTVPWHRMPGYGLFCALAAVIGQTTDVVEIAMVVVVLQVILYAAAVGVFVAVARRPFGVPVACLLGVLITLLPKQLNYTQADTIIASLALLVLSALLIYLGSETSSAPAPFSAFVLVNVSFALWFAMRTDVLPGWVVVSAVLAGRRWWRFGVTAVLIAAIAVPWALYKRQYRHEFNLLPTNTGEVLFLSLCEAPGAFPYECTDNGYVEWSRRAGHPDATSQSASTLATAEVIRYWATYPVHFSFMVWYKFRRSVFGESWPGFRSRLSILYGGFVREVGLFIVLLTVLGVALAVNHQRRRSLLLGWVLFLNMPTFFLVFASNGRFYPAAGVSLLVSAVPLLFEPGLYAQMRRHRYRAVLVLACAVLFVAEGRRVEDWVRGNDALHYWAPILDPKHSSIGLVVR
jgi:hypothetical protein